ncbi:MAG TPA: HD-GYP domain-containing protein [Bacillota bacterium]
MPQTERDLLIRRYLVYVTAVAVLTAVIFAPREPRWWEILLFVLLTLATESASIPFLRQSSSMSVGFALIHASVLLFEPPVATWIAAMGTIRARDLRGSVPVRLVVFNRLQLAAAAATASWVFRLAGGDLDQFASWDTVLAALAGGTAYFAVNVAMVLVSFSLLQRLPNWRHIFVTGLRWVAANWVTVLPISYLMAVTYHAARLGPLAIVFYSIPLLAARQSFQLYVDARKQYLDTIRSLAAALEARDPYTFGHAERVARMAVEVGRQLRLPQADLESLEVAALLHDVGKIGIADGILRKTERYTARDFREMMKHPIIGARIVANVKSLDRLASWVRHHHERMDGQGYPDGLCGDKIPLGARIISVVDSFDAMISARPYKPTRTVHEALEELDRCSGTQFDPQVVQAFRRAIDDGARLVDILAGASEFTAELMRGLDDEIPDREQIRPYAGGSPGGNG